MSAPRIEPWKPAEESGFNCPSSESKAAKTNRAEATASSKHKADCLKWENRHDWFAATSECDSAMEGLVQKGLRLVKSKEIKAYLLLLPDMIDIVSAVGKAVLKRFPQPSQVALELYQDPESVDQYLTVYVRQHNYDEKVLDVLEEVSAESEEARGRCSGWLLITTDFKRPI